MGGTLQTGMQNHRSSMTRWGRARRAGGTIRRYSAVEAASVPKLEAFRDFAAVEAEVMRDAAIESNGGKVGALSPLIFEPR